MSTFPELPFDVIAAPTYRTQCETDNLLFTEGPEVPEVPEVPAVPPSISIGFPILLALVLLLDRRLLNKLDRTRRSKIAGVIVLVVLLSLPSLLDALFSLLQTAIAFEDNNEIVNSLSKCLDGIIPKSINGLILELFVLVSGLAASIGELFVIMFGVFEDYKRPELRLKKRRLFAGIVTLVVSALVGAFILLRARFTGFGCVYDKEFDRYFCYAEETADRVSNVYGTSLESLKVCDRANSFVQGSISQSSVPPRCMAGTIAATVQSHFQTVVQSGVSNAFSAARIATAVFCLLSLLANLSFIVYRLWRKTDLGMPWVISALFMVGISNSMIVFLFILRRLYAVDRVRVVACGCAVEEVDLDWPALVRNLSGMLMSLNVVISYSKLDLRPNDVKPQSRV